MSGWPAGARSEGADAAQLGERLLPIEEAAPASTTRCTPKVRCGAAVACAVVLTACGVVYSSMPDMAPAGRTRQHIHHNSSAGGCAVHIDISASKFRSTHGILWVHNNSVSWKAANSPTTTSAGDNALLKRVHEVSMPVASYKLTFTRAGSYAVLLLDDRNHNGKVRGHCRPQNPKPPSHICTFVHHPLRHITPSRPRCLCHGAWLHAQLDTDFLGIPVEGVGVSNGAKGGPSGGPKWADAKVHLSCGDTLAIALKLWPT